MFKVFCAFFYSCHIYNFTYILPSNWPNLTPLTTTWSLCTLEIQRLIRIIFCNLWHKGACACQNDYCPWSRITSSICFLMFTSTYSVRDTIRMYDDSPSHTHFVQFGMILSHMRCDLISFPTCCLPFLHLTHE